MNKNIIKSYNIIDDYYIYELYSHILNKYEILDDNLVVFFNNILNFIINLRDNEHDYIWTTIENLLEINHYLPDIVFILWCYTPEYSDNYILNYSNNIKLYLPKLLINIDNNILQNFCLDSLSKKIYLPLHCLDILWYYMHILELKLSIVFSNYYHGDYIGIDILSDDDENYTIKLQLNLQYILELNIGCHTNDFSFKKFIENVILKDVDVFKSMLNCSTKDNFLKQIKFIIDNIDIYFPNTIVPQELLNLI